MNSRVDGTQSERSDNCVMTDASWDTDLEVRWGVAPPPGGIFVSHNSGEGTLLTPSGQRPSCRHARGSTPTPKIYLIPNFSSAKIETP